VSRLLRDLGGADPYQVLGLSPEASDHDVTAAHRRLIRQLHPDVSPGQEERAKLLNLARDVLRDPISRAEYDLSTRRRTIPAQPVDLDDEIVVGDQNEEFLDDEAKPDEFTSASDDDDVFAGLWTRTPAPPEPPLWRSPVPPAAPGPQPFPPAGSPPPTRVHVWPARSGGLPLAVWALIVSLFCGPVGLPLGIVALKRKMPADSADRVCATIAVAWSSLTLLCCCGYVGVVAAGTLLGVNGQ
jgi:hypothetical protein